MPRTARIYQKSLCYHLINRGVNKNAIFNDEQDLSYFTKLIQEYREICSARIYHWAWMKTHYHMLIEIVFDNLRPFASGIQQVYATYHHRRHESRGTFWQGRFISVPVEMDESLVRCGRYIERNPVRAGVVEKAWEYTWSSAAYYALGAEDELTNTNPYLGLEGNTQDKAWYKGQLDATDDEEWMRKQGKTIIGSEYFRKSLKKEKGHFRRRRGKPVQQKS